MSQQPSSGSQSVLASVERAIEVLLLFTRVNSSDLGVTEIASHLGLSKAVVHRILATLASKSFVETCETTRRYRLGPAALSLGEAYRDRIDLRAMARPILQGLSDLTGETATMSLRYAWERIYVDQVTPEREVKMTVALGYPFPLHAGSSSKAFLAFLTPDQQEQYLTGQALKPLTERTITDPEQMRNEIATVRRQGYAISYGERQAGAASVAAPVLDHRSRPAAVISICGPEERFAEAVHDITNVLLEATHDLSLRLGHH